MMHGVDDARLGTARRALVDSFRAVNRAERCPVSARWRRSTPSLRSGVRISRSGHTIGISEDMNLRLDGRVALVAGGSRGIGSAVAKALAAAGADVAITYSEGAPAACSVVTDLAILGVRGSSYQFDGSDRVVAGRIVAGVIQKLGGVDILIDMRTTVALAEDVSSGAGRDGVARSGLALILASADLIRDGGRIIAVSAALPVHGDQVSPHGALEACITGLAKDLHSRRVTANILVYRLAGIPDGGALTDRRQISAEGEDEEDGRHAAFTSVITTLASPASSYITGSQLVMD